jgi:hypothetical protein
MKNTWYKFQKMIGNEIPHFIGSIRLVSGFLLAFAFFLSIQCTSKNESPQTGILSSLHIGLSLYSTKILVQNAGWAYDTMSNSAKETTSLVLRVIHLPNIDNPFTGILTFQNRKLAIIALNNIAPVPGSIHSHDLKDYNQLVTIFQSIYGSPTHVGANMTSPQGIEEHTDTTFITMWFDKNAKSYCTVQYDALYGRLSFTAMGAAMGNFNSMQYQPKNASHMNSILAGLQAGLPLDSAKKMTKNVGWVCDSEIDDTPAETIVLQFRDVHLPNIDNSFIGLLNFRYGRLIGFSLNENPALHSTQDSRTIHNLNDYKQLIAVLKSLYGHPHDSGSTINPQLHSADRVDTSHLTTWLDKGNYYSAQYDDLNGSIEFTALFLGKE